MDNNTHNRRAEFYNDLPREVVEFLMRDDEKTLDIKEEKLNTNNIDESITHVHTVKHAQTATPEVHTPEPEPLHEEKPAIEIDLDLPSEEDAPEEETTISKTLSFLEFGTEEVPEKPIEHENVEASKEAVQKSKDELDGIVSEKKDAVRSRRKNYDDINEDPERIQKTVELDNMFDHKKAKRKKRGGSGAGLIIALIVFIVAAGYFGYQYMVLSKDMVKSETIAAEAADLQTKYEELKLENMSLSAEVETLKADLKLMEERAVKAEEALPKESEETTEETAPTTTTYTVEKGDTFWSIAQKFYGNGAEYGKILTANNLRESSPLSQGDTLIIPN